MSIVLDVEQRTDLDWMYLVYTWDTKDGVPDDVFGTLSNPFVATTAPELQALGLVSENPLEKGRYYITQSGADYLRKDARIATPFDAMGESEKAK
jgi:helix-turn-helix protein